MKNRWCPSQLSLKFWNSSIWNSIQNATKWLWNLWNLAMNTLIWICVFVLLRQGFVSVVARISFGMLIDPVTVAVRAWLSACPSLASDVDRQLTLCELVPVGWCCQGWLGEPKDNSSPKQQRGDMPCHEATLTAGWSWQPLTVWLGTAYIFSAGILKGKHMSTVYIHKLIHASDLQISMKWVIRYISQIILVNEHIIAEPVVYSQFLLASLHT